MTPIHASLTKNEGFAYKNLLEKRKKVKPKIPVNDLVRTADLNVNCFLKSDTTNWSYKLSKFTEIVADTIPSYKIKNFPERYNQSLLKRSELTLKKNISVMKNLNLN